MMPSKAKLLGFEGRNATLLALLALWRARAWSWRRSDSCWESLFQLQRSNHVCTYLTQRNLIERVVTWSIYQNDLKSRREDVIVSALV